MDVQELAGNEVLRLVEEYDKEERVKVNVSKWVVFHFLTRTFIQSMTLTAIVKWKTVGKLLFYYIRKGNQLSLHVQVGQFHKQVW